MILAAGLSPAWQRIMVFDSFDVGEVNRASQVVHCASGKVLNVAIGLNHLGAEVHCLSLVGGTPAAAMQKEFAELKIPITWVTTSSATRTCLTIVDEERDNQTTELVENAEPISDSELAQWIREFHQLAENCQLLVLSGSLPQGVTKTLYADLLELSDSTAILDVRREELLAALPHRPLVIKPNREELEQTVGRTLSRTDDLIDAAEDLRRAGAEWVVISDGPRPVTVIGPEERGLIAVPEVQRIVNPIGCGDSMTAGIAAAVDAGESVMEGVKWGIACSTRNLQMLLPARLDRQHMNEVARCLTVESL